MSLRERIFSKKETSVSELNLIEMHDYLMSEYGWIPLEEFKAIPIPTAMSLCDCIKRRYEKQAEMSKSKGKK
jgi:hypothetical protein